MATAPLRLPDLAFDDAEGKPRKLSDWRGRTVLVNLWATWCVPCRKEMPALDEPAGQARRAGFRGGRRQYRHPRSRKAEELPERRQSDPARLFQPTQKAKVFQDLKAVGRALGMPTSVLVDRQGCEIATIAGPAEWASDDAVKLIRAAMVPAACRSFRLKRRDCRRRRRRDWPAAGRVPSRVITADFSASAFDFIIAAATCIWVLPACIARRLLTIAIMSIRILSDGRTLPGRWLTNAGNGEPEREIEGRPASSGLAHDRLFRRFVRGRMPFESGNASYRVGTGFSPR